MGGRVGASERPFVLGLRGGREIGPSCSLLHRAATQLNWTPSAPLAERV